MTLTRRDGGNAAERIGRRITPDGSVIVPPRIAAWLNGKSGLTPERRIMLRGTDPEAYEVLAALHLASLGYRSGSGTKSREAHHNSPESETWLTTTEAARHVGVTDRCIRKWIADGRLPAKRHGNRHRVSLHHLNIRLLAA